MSPTSFLQPVKYINDPLYGGIPITELELRLISLPIFQRLRRLSQLGRVNYTFPGAEHSRFVHSLGVLNVMRMMSDHLLTRDGDKLKKSEVVLLRVAALLHDIGHYPLSHLGESVYGYCLGAERSNSIFEETSDGPGPIYHMASAHSKTAHHEALGKYIVTHHEGVVRILEEADIDPQMVGRIITGEIGSEHMAYSQLLHSSLDADRLDYLLRDSLQTGVTYGKVDLEYLIRLLMIVDDATLGGQDTRVLALNQKGQHVVEHFLMSRYFHYMQVIYHHSNAAFEGLTKVLYTKLVQSGNYLFDSYHKIKEKIDSEEFLQFTDFSLETAMEEYFTRTDVPAEDHKLYLMYRDRVRPKTVLEVQDLYSTNPSPKMVKLKHYVKHHPDAISSIVGDTLWGFQIAPFSIEKVHGQYTLEALELLNGEDQEALREAIKLYDTQEKRITYLGADRTSLVGHTAHLTKEVGRIFLLSERTEADYREIQSKLSELVGS